jgi:soluble lytic murein transglycosylase-like protein
MSRVLCFVLLASSVLPAQVQSRREANLSESEYYVMAYARHYGVPVRFVRAIVAQESGWHACAVSPKGAMGLMQLMPSTATRLRVRNRCNVNENVAAGVFYLASLMRRFPGDLRLVAAAYMAGEGIVAKRGLAYRNREVVAYVSRIRARCQQRPAKPCEEIPRLVRSGAAQ